MFRDAPGGASATCRVTPRAGRSAFAGVREGAILVRISAAPVEGAANDAFISFLAQSLSVPRRAIAIVAGERSRTKRVLVTGVHASELNDRLARLLGQR